MAINVSIQRTFPGFGVSTLSSIQQATGIAITSGTAYYVPGTTSNSVAGLLVPTITVGRVRVKIYNGAGTTPTVLSVLVQAYDGTNLVTLDQFYVPTSTPTPPTLSTTAWFDRMFDFVCDTAPSTTSGGAVGYLIGVGAWSDRTADALEPLVRTPPQLVAAAVNTPEYLTS